MLINYILISKLEFKYFKTSLKKLDFYNKIISKIFILNIIKKNIIQYYQ